MFTPTHTNFLKSQNLDIKIAITPEEAVILMKAFKLYSREANGREALLLDDLIQKLTSEVVTATTKVNELTKVAS